MNNIDCIFFDLGSTLIDETLAYEHRFRDGITDTNIFFEQVYSKAVEFYRQGKKGDLEAFKYYNLPKTEWHSEDEILYPATVKVLEVLSQSYKLGVIANQNFGTKELSENNLNIYTCLICPVCRYNTLKYVSIPAVLCLTQNKLSCV